MHLTSQEKILLRRAPNCFCSQFFGTGEIFSFRFFLFEKNAVSMT